MPWPDDRDLPLEVWAAFGADPTTDPGTWSWTDLTSRLLPDQSVTIQYGKRPGAAQVSASTGSVTLDNDDGALTPLHPGSPYWPNVELNTPIRLTVRRAEDAFGRTVSSGWGTADSGQAWSTASGPASDYSVAAGAGRHSHPITNQIRRTELAVGLVDVEQVVDVTTPVLLTGAALVVGTVARRDPVTDTYYWFRCEFNPGGTSVAAKISKWNGASFVDLAVLSPVPSLTYAANTPMRIRTSTVGSALSMKIWPAASAEPSGWTLAVTDSSITAAGRTGLQSWLVAGNTNTLPLVVSYDNYAARVDRLDGTADQWQPTYQPRSDGTTRSVVRLTASGILRRLGQGSAPEQSPLRRTLAASGPVAYWPGEDGEAATQLASAIPGHPAMTAAGPVTFAQPDAWAPGIPADYGSAALVDVSAGARLSVTVPTEVTAATATQWTVYIQAAVNPGTPAGDVVLAEWTTPGATYVRWQIVWTALDSRVIGYTASGASTVLVIGGLIAGLGAWSVSASVTGGTVNIRYRAEADYTTSFAGSLAGVTALRSNPTGMTASSQLTVGHAAIWANTAQPPGTLVQVSDPYGVTIFTAQESYVSEAALDRLVRLCLEDDVPLTVVGGPDLTSLSRMGVQPIATSADLYQDCVDVDGGVLYERGWGLGYLPRAGRYNPKPVLTVPLSTYATTSGTTGSVVAPAYDDQGVVNEYTVSRSGGSQATAADTADQQRRGRRPGSAELNLADDSELDSQAGWGLRLRSVAELRDGTIPLDLAANPTLVDGWLSCGMGGLIRRTGLPAQYPAGTVDRIVDGWTETIGPRSWTAQVAVSPAAPWTVGEADGDARAPADGSTLATGINSSALTLSLSSTAANGVWVTGTTVTNPTDFPLDLRIGGERVTCTGISGTASPQTVTLSARAVNGISRSWLAGTTVDVWTPAVAAL